MARVRSSRRDTPFPLPALWSARASKVALLVVAVVLSLTPCYHAMTTNGDKILNQLGETVELKGANWFGFNNGATMVDGMWNSSNGMSYDFATVIYRWQLLGFNTIRLPFSMSDLYDKSPFNKFSDFCNLPSLALLTMYPMGVTSVAVITGGTGNYFGVYGSAALKMNCFEAVTPGVPCVDSILSVGMK
eukprot:gene22611-29753_t